MAQTTRIRKCKVNEKTLAIKTVKIFARLKLSNQVLACSNFVLASHDMVTDTSRTTTCRPRFETPSVLPHIRWYIVPKASQPVVEKNSTDHNFLTLHDARKLEIYVDAFSFCHNSAKGVQFER